MKSNDTLSLADAPDPAVTPTAQAEPRGRGPAGNRFSIRLDLVNIKSADLPERQRVALRWIAGYCISTNQSHRDVAPKLKQASGEPYSHDSLYHALTGGRTEEQLVNIVDAIERFRKITEERTQVIKTGFVETAISRKIWKYCRKALRRQRVGVIIGDSQIGKSISLLEYAKANNHGETKYLRLPVGCGYGLFLRLLAGVLGVPIYASEMALRDGIMNAVDEHMLLIFDELHEPFGAKGDNALGVKIVNFIREIYDRKQCGAILCGTKVFEDAMFMGTFAKNMQQIVRRSLPLLRLPAVPGDADMAVFAAKYGLGVAPREEMAVNVKFTDDEGIEQKATVKDAPYKLQTAVVKSTGLGRWLLILEEAADLAHERRRPISWGLVLVAWDAFERDSKFSVGNTANDTEEAA